VEVKEEAVAVEVKVEPVAEEEDLRAPWRQRPSPPAPLPPWRQLTPSPPSYPPPCYVVSATIAAGAERPPPWGTVASASSQSQWRPTPHSTAGAGSSAAKEVNWDDI